MVAYLEEEENMKIQFTTLLLAGLLAATTAHAKLPYNEIEDLRGHKILVTQLAGTSYKQKSASKATKEAVEFLFLGATDIWVIGENSVRAVRTPALGSNEFEWDGGNDRIYQIPAYPADNDHSPVKGFVYDANSGSKMGTFQLFHRPSKWRKGKNVSGRWVGEMGFPGGYGAQLSLNVASTVQQTSGCTDGSSPARVAVLGYGYQDASLSHCEKGFFPHGDYYSQFFVWDDSHDRLWFVVLNGDVTPNGQILQGRVETFELLGQGGWSEGLFILGRPPVFHP
jgi:hypothetical protein